MRKSLVLIGLAVAFLAGMARAAEDAKPVISELPNYKNAPYILFRNLPQGRLASEDYYCTFPDFDTPDWLTSPEFVPVPVEVYGDTYSQYLSDADNVIRVYFDVNKFKRGAAVYAEWLSRKENKVRLYFHRKSLVDDVWVLEHEIDIKPPAPASNR